MRKHRKYAKHYRDEWEKMPCFKNWLTRSSEKLINSGKGEAYCKLCSTPLHAQKYDLEKHMKAKSHTEREKNMLEETQPKRAKFGVAAANIEKENDLKMSVYVATHGSIKNLDHLGEIVKEMGKGSPLENLQLHRTKCSNIIKTILEPELRSDLIKEIGERPYSIILDESTDVPFGKYMAYMIRYFNTQQKNIVVDFLGFQEIHNAAAAVLHTAFKEFTNEMGLNLNNLIAIGADGASNLCGRRHSLYTLLKEEFPQLQLLKCVCHSLSLCAAKACEELPTSLEYLLRETRNWFAHSPLRLKKYQALYETLNDNKKPAKLTQVSATRWLAYYAAVHSNIKQWIPLKTHFNIIVTAGEKCYQARELVNMYNDESHLLYLEFWEPLLKDVTDVNVIFQAENANITNTYNDLRVLLMSTARRIFKPSFLRATHFLEADPLVQDIESVKTALSKAHMVFENSMLSIENVDFGSKFEVLAQKIEASKVADVRKRCVGVLVRLCQELVNRLPDNMTIVKTLSSFDTQNVINGFPNKLLPWELAPVNINRDEIERQRKLVSILSLKDIIKNAENLTPEKLWISLLDIKNAGGQHVCKDLAEFALRALSLPVSNATVESVFSTMNIVKTKIRNRMQLSMLQAITRIRLYMSVRNICCKSFCPTNNMIKMHSATTEKTNEQERTNEAEPSTSTSTAVSASCEDDGVILEEVMLFIDEL